MKKFLGLIFLFPMVLLSQNNPPPDYIEKSIIVEDDYHVFFNFSTGVNTFKTQSGWDIALYNEIHEVGGKINETQGVKLWRVYGDTNVFNSISLADTTNPVLNSESIFYLGALDTLYTGTVSSYFNIGIGKFYTSPTYKSIPDRMYIVKREDNIYGKFYISYSSSGSRNFIVKYSDIDNSNANTYVVPKLTPLARHYSYLNLKNGSISSGFEVEFDSWDILFKPYKVGNTDYPVGVLTNNAHNLIRISNVTGFPDSYLKQGVVKTECYEAVGDPISVQYNGSLDASDPISRNYNQIGEKWFNTSTNQPATGKSYFIKDKTGKIWHLVFTSYDAANKIVNIAYQRKGTVSIEDVAINNQLVVVQKGNFLSFENPNYYGETTSVEIYDISGKSIYKFNMNKEEEVDVSSLSNSMIFIHTQTSKTSNNIKYFVR